MLRSILGAVLAALAAALTCVWVLALTGGSSEDLGGFGVIAFVTTLALALVVYLPALALIRGRRWSRTRTIAVAATALNTPAYLVLLAGLSRGGMFGGWTEVALFAAAYVIAAIVFVIVGSGSTERT